MKNNNLNVGVVNTNKFLADIVKETLNHLGIPFKEIDEKTSEHFPCIILPEYEREDFSIATKLCQSEDNILIFENEFSIQTFYLALGGFLEYNRIENRLREPILNIIELELLKKIKECFFSLDIPLLRKWYWPNFASACFIATHDVDCLDPIIPISSLKDKISLDWLKVLFRFIRRDIGKDILKLLQREIQRKIRSTFYFFPDYGKYNKIFLDMLRLLDQNGCEIGLHGSEFSYHSLDQLKDEKKQLEKIIKSDIKGIRQHNLNFLPPFTWQCQETSGFTHDLSYSYSDEFGFRSGTCFPYHPVDIIERKKFKLLELPTSFMDWTVLYRKMNYSETWDILMDLEKAIERFHGCFIVNFHNSYQISNHLIKKVYSNLLDHVKNRNYWITVSGECSSWWLKRENTTVNASYYNKTVEGTLSSPLPIIIETDEDIINLDLRRTSFRVVLK